MFFFSNLAKKKKTVEDQQDWKQIKQLSKCQVLCL